MLGVGMPLKGFSLMRGGTLLGCEVIIIIILKTKTWLLWNIPSQKHVFYRASEEASTHFPGNAENSSGKADEK